MALLDICRLFIQLLLLLSGFHCLWTVKETVYSKIDRSLRSFLFAFAKSDKQHIPSLYLLLGSTQNCAELIYSWIYGVINLFLYLYCRCLFLLHMHTYFCTPYTAHWFVPTIMRYLRKATQEKAEKNSFCEYMCECFFLAFAYSPLCYVIYMDA